jgi:hypothetical protein
MLSRLHPRARQSSHFVFTSMAPSFPTVRCECSQAHTLAECSHASRFSRSLTLSGLLRVASAGESWRCGHWSCTRRRKRVTIVFVDSRVREHGDINKRHADIALATLLTAVTREKWTAVALRMARSRANKSLGRKRIPHSRRRKARTVRGAKPREPRLVPSNFEEIYRKELEPDDPAELPTDAEESADGDEPDPSS